MIPSNLEFTQRELAVVCALIAGKSNKQVALQLDISTRAVEYHLTHIYEKLRVSSRTQAIIELINMFKE
ncbi:MAG: response regulator transcription factor [Chloroflexi bacterium]|nr:response regulator transcription factor [Chloroflexota bacterium]MBI3340721.1 response regulator transcription factor [Chloroflexota bacterium]